MAESDARKRRRVVVTGVGLVSPLAVGTEDTWSGIVAGRSGVGPITLFDAARYSTRFAGEVPGFDPLGWLDKKDVKKCARFIQFAVAATAMAMDQSGLRIEPANATRVGVVIGSGIGGFEVIEREHRILLERGPERVSPFFILSSIINLAAGLRLGSSRREGTELGGRDRLHDRRARRRRRVPADPGGICGRDDLRRRRGGHHAARRGRLRGHARPVHAKRRPRSSEPALGRRS